MAVVAVGDNISDCYIDVGRLYPGGNAVNVAVAVARANGTASYNGDVGTDAGGDLLRASLVAEGVDVMGLRSRDGETALAVVGHADDGERVFGGLDRGVALFTPDADDLDRIGAHTIVHTTYCSGLESAVPLLAERALLSYDFDVHVDDGYADELLTSVWLASFSAAHLDEDACHKLVRWAHERGARYVLAMRGPHGAILSDGIDLVTAAPDPAAIVDTLGAGDACIGRVLHHLELGRPPQTALASAVRAATAACTWWGGYGHGIELTDDVRERARALQDELQEVHPELPEHDQRASPTDASQEEE
jgi:fructoselysine 6-kinase